MVNESALTSLTFTHPLRIRSKKWVPVHRGVHGQEPGETVGRVRRLEITWWQKVLGFLGPQDVGSSEWKDEDGITTVTLHQHGGLWKALFRGTWDIVRNGERIGTVQRARGLQGLRAVFRVQLGNENYCLTNPMLGTETRFVRGVDPENDADPLMVMRRNAVGVLKAHTVHVHDNEVDVGVVLAIYHQYCIHMAKSLRDWGPKHS